MDHIGQVCALLEEITTFGADNPPLPEYTPLFNNYMQHPQNLPLPPRIYPPPLILTTICDPPRIYPSLPPYQSQPPLFNNHMQHSQNLPLHPRIYPAFLTAICVPSRIYPYLPDFRYVILLFQISEPPLAVHTLVTLQPPF